MSENKTPTPAVKDTAEDEKAEAAPESGPAATIEPTEAKAADQSGGQSAEAKATETERDQSKSTPPKPKVHPNRAAYELLHGHYPELFDLKAAKPLQIGIHVSLAEDGKLSKTKIRRALNYYVQQLAYIRSVANGGARHGLTGEAGNVSEEDQLHAKARVEDIEAKRKAKREERRQAQQKKSRAGNKPGEKGKGRKAGADPARKPARKSPQRGDRDSRGSDSPNGGNPTGDTKASGNKEERMNQKLASLAERFNNG